LRRPVELTSSQREAYSYLLGMYLGDGYTCRSRHLCARVYRNGRVPTQTRCVGT